MLSIGEFSKITGLTVKTLRFYHDKGLLIPAHVDGPSGYRYYSPAQAELAAAISQLRRLDFPLSEIAEIVEHAGDAADILDHLQQQRERIEQQRHELLHMIEAIDQIIANEQEAREVMSHNNYEVEEKLLEPVLVAGIRMKGKYQDCGKGFAKLGRYFGRFISGKPFLLHYDDEYKEDDADFEACMPIRQQGKEVDGVDVRVLPGGRCVSLLHLGPYDEISRSYRKIMEYIDEQGLECSLPTREVYIKGPGMIFRGNPKKYLTEIQMVVE